MKIELLILNIALIILGLLMFIFPYGFNAMICITVGTGLCIWGIIRVISYFMTKSEEIFGSFGLVQGGAMIGFGLYFLLNPSVFIQIIDASLGIILLITAVLKFQYAFDFFKMKSKKWWIHLIGSGIMLICGILALTKPFGIANFIMMFIGLSLIFSSVWDIITLISVSRILKNIAEPEKDSRYVDAEAYDEEDTDNS